MQMQTLIPALCLPKQEKQGWKRTHFLAALHQKHKAVATRGEVKRLEELLTFPRSKEGVSNSSKDDKVYGAFSPPPLSCFMYR